MTLRHPPHPPPPPPHHHHSSSGGGGGGSSSYHSGGSGSYSTYSSSSSVGGAGLHFPTSGITLQGSLLFVAVGALMVQMFGFFRTNCNTPNSKRRLGYLDVADGQPTGFLPYRDNPLRNRRKHPSSPNHPAIRSTPSKSINNETMKLLNHGGIRMMAHGVHCEPRRVWISIDDRSIMWQSEFQKTVPDRDGNPSTLAVRGSLHRIDWDSIEYIDVGKRTDALKQATQVADHLCFSLLTPDGSLDLQTNSQLERDTLVSCLGMKLDEIHGGDWRQLYLASNGGDTMSDTNGSGSSSGFISQSSFSTVNQPYPNMTLDV
eukprot:scaffold6661_cov109-Cylindrotheca_fusiformis.AAC.1